MKTFKRFVLLGVVMSLLSFLVPMSKVVAATTPRILGVEEARPTIFKTTLIVAIDDLAAKDCNTWLRNFADQNDAWWYAQSRSLQGAVLFSQRATTEITSSGLRCRVSLNQIWVNTGDVVPVEFDRLRLAGSVEVGLFKNSNAMPLTPVLTIQANMASVVPSIKIKGIARGDVVERARKIEVVVSSPDGIVCTQALPCGVNVYGSGLTVRKVGNGTYWIWAKESQPAAELIASVSVHADGFNSDQPGGTDFYERVLFTLRGDSTPKYRTLDWPTSVVEEGPPTPIRVQVTSAGVPLPGFELCFEDDPECPVNAEQFLARTGSEGIAILGLLTNSVFGSYLYCWFEGCPKTAKLERPDIAVFAFKNQTGSYVRAVGYGDAGYQRSVTSGQKCSLVIERKAGNSWVIVARNDSKNSYVLDFKVSSPGMFRARTLPCSWTVAKTSLEVAGRGNPEVRTICTQYYERTSCVSSIYRPRLYRVTSKLVKVSLSSAVSAEISVRI